MKFLNIIVVSSLVLCGLYGVVAIAFQALSGEELSPTLTEKWFQLFGTELVATAFIHIAKTITAKIKVRNKIEYMKENGIEPSRDDFQESSDGYQYSYPDDSFDIYG